MADIRFFIDGVSVPNASTSTAAVMTGTATNRLGDSFNTALDRDFNGNLDDVRIYSSALSPTEIQALFNAGRLVRGLATDKPSIIAGSSANLSWEAAHLRTPVATGTADDFSLGSHRIGASTFDFGGLTAGPAYHLRANSGTHLGRIFKVTAFDPAAKTFTLENGDLLVADGTAALWNGSFDLYSYTLGYESLTLTNDRDATVIDAAALSTAGLGTLAVSPAVTTTYTTTADGQPLLDAGSFPVPAPITATTTYTLTAWLDESGAGSPATLQTTATVQPAPDFTLHAAPAFTTPGTPVTLNWNATVTRSTATTGTFDFFASAPGEPLVDLDADFTALLQPGTSYFIEITNGTIAGSTAAVTSWSGNDLFVSNNFADNTSWTTYRIFTQSGTDRIVIQNGATTLATITDPAQIASGTLVLDPGPAAATTYTATGATASAVDTATVTIGGPTTSYPAVM